MIIIASTRGMRQTKKTKKTKVMYVWLPFVFTSTSLYLETNNLLINTTQPFVWLLKVNRILANEFPHEDLRMRIRVAHAILSDDRKKRAFCMMPADWRAAVVPRLVRRINASDRRRNRLACVRATTPRPSNAVIR